jgi:hypothetical protein
VLKNGGEYINAGCGCKSSIRRNCANIQKNMRFHAGFWGGNANLLDSVNCLLEYQGTKKYRFTLIEHSKEETP